MNSYLLLRSNKESGPFTLQQLLENGLKAYDLVWVPGKSAAWRYPSELEELKPYAPQVEEQPFDRFYKKTTAEQQAAEEKPFLQKARTINEAVAIQTADKKNVYETPVEEPVVKKTAPVKETSEYEPKVIVTTAEQPARKAVYVTMPKQVKQPVNTTAPVAKTEEPVPAVRKEETTVTAQINYSQPLDDIKEMYVKTLQDRKEKIARQTFLQTTLKRVAVVAGLIGVGVLAGFIIKPKQPKSVIAATETLASQNSSPAEEPVQEEIPVTDPAQNNIVENTSIESETATTLAEQQMITPPQQKESVAKINAIKENRPSIDPAKEKSSTIPVSKKEVYKEPVLTENSIPESTERNPVTGERSKKVRTGNSTTTNDQTVPRSVNAGTTAATGKLSKQVSVSSNEYKKVAFGGIRNLQLTVTNNSAHELDNVIVELLYLKPSEEPLKTENIKFRSIAPNTSATIRIPDTNRGIKVSYKIIRIDSKDDIAGN